MPKIYSIERALARLRSVQAFESWLTEVKESLSSMKMSFDRWQKAWAFDFQQEFHAGTAAKNAAMKARRFWCHQQNKALDHECRKTPNCWLPRDHQGDCQPW
jgi:hypothetical protein